MVVLYRLNVQVERIAGLYVFVTYTFLIAAAAMVADGMVRVPAESSVSTGVGSVIDVVITAVAAAGTGLRGCSLAFLIDGFANE